MRRVRISHWLAALLTLLAANAAAAQDRARIVAVNYPLQYFAERLLGDEAEVVFPVPADVDPSFWRPAISDISMIQSADLILLNGAGFATWVDRVSLPRSRLVNTSAAIRDQFIVTESITHSHGDGGEHSHEGLASYTWLDPMLAIAQAEAIAGAIAGRELAQADAVYANFAELRSDLEQLDADAQAALAGAQDVPMIATHPRYQYLARRYDLSITSLEWEPGVMPTDAELAELEALVAETGSRVLIWEAAPPPAAFEATAALGLDNVVFNTLARGAADDGYIAAFDAAIADLSDAVAQNPGN
ncbi:metal ABC transporter substrate-binding protein [Cognatiyoonia sp. IB215446]|uniref:metal ABC transporter substrate-binding protein n=1 Tax=Cognatiyoonia sp. IB215446 TaxID=3097355 RepID=UPI002A122D72|nr:metal ABC transporter substrate-binding protein [Cognatiyoonia sp. IB215446]MDX8349996.1 metal ABC transporter substrate-binding protein [Cognatiyoonia sp. IB215446]